MSDRRPFTKPAWSLAIVVLSLVLITREVFGTSDLWSLAAYSTWLAFALTRHRIMAWLDRLVERWEDQVRSNRAGG